MAAAPETSSMFPDHAGSSHSTGLVPSASVNMNPRTNSIVLRTAKGDLSAEPRTLSRRLPPMPLVSIITPGRALRALEMSALPNPLVNNESVVQRVTVICSGASRGLKMEMAAESRATQFHMRLSVVAEEAEARAFTGRLPRAQSTPTQNHRFNSFMLASSSLYGHDPRHRSSI